MILPIEKNFRYIYIKKCFLPLEINSFAINFAVYKFDLKNGSIIEDLFREMHTKPLSHSIIFLARKPT